MSPATSGVVPGRRRRAVRARGTAAVDELVEGRRGGPGRAAGPARRAAAAGGSGAARRAAPTAAGAGGKPGRWLVNKCTRHTGLTITQRGHLSALGIESLTTGTTTSGSNAP